MGAVSPPRPPVTPDPLRVFVVILDKESGAIAGIVSVGTAKWISDSEVEIGGGFYDGQVIEYRYRMVRTNIGWIVSGKEFVMES